MMAVKICPDLEEEPEGVRSTGRGTERVSCGPGVLRDSEVLQDSDCSRNEWRTGEDWESTADPKESVQ